MIVQKFFLKHQPKAPLLQTKSSPQHTQLPCRAPDHRFCLTATWKTKDLNTYFEQPVLSSRLKHQPSHKSSFLILLLPPNFKLHSCTTKLKDLFYCRPQNSSSLFQYIFFSSVIIQSMHNNKFSVLHTPRCICKRVISVLQKHSFVNKLHYQAQKSK